MIREELKYESEERKKRGEAILVQDEVVAQRSESSVSAPPLGLSEEVSITKIRKEIELRA